MRWRVSIRRGLAAALVLMAVTVAIPSQQALGQETTNPYLLDGGAFTNALMANDLADRIRRASGYATRPAPPRPSTQGSLAFRRVPGLSTPRELARRFPADQRGKAEVVFRELIVTMGRVERQFGQPKRDIATALAFVIGSTHEAATGQPFDLRNARPLIRQVRTALRADRRITGARHATKQRLYEQLAIVGVATSGVTVALERQPDAALEARVRTGSARLFRKLVGVDATEITFTSKGMVRRK